MSALLLRNIFFAAALCSALPGCSEPAETAVPKLVKQLQSKDSHERNTAAQALGGYGSEAGQAVDPLIRALWDDNMGVRTSAAYSLRKIGTPKAIKAIEFYKREKERQNKERQNKEED